MEVELFGRGGTRVRVETGDVIVLPAGVSHSMVGNSDDILMVGGYPGGPRLGQYPGGPHHRGDPPGRRQADHDAADPGRDPVTGEPIREWIEAPSSVDAGLNDFRDGLDPV